MTEIAGLAHARGARVVVDGAQAVGAIPVSVAELGVDFYAIPGQKWLLGPEGTGALWCDPAIVAASRPTNASWFTFERLTPTEAVPWRDARRFDDSGHYRPGITGLARSCGWLSMYIGLPWIHERGWRWPAAPPTAWPRSPASSSSRRATGWRRSSHSGSAAGHPMRRSPSSAAGCSRSPGRSRPRRDPDQRRVLHDRGRDRAVAEARRAARGAHARDVPAAAGAHDPRPGRRDGPAPTAGPAADVRQRSWARSGGASSGTRRGRSSGPSWRAWSSRSSSGSGYLAYDVAMRRGAVAARAATCGRSISSSTSSLVLVVGSVVTWLVVPSRAARDRETRSPWSAALGFFAAVPVCYLVLVVVVQVLEPLLG